MKLNLIAYGLGAIALFASCSDNKGKASEASEAALKSINSETQDGKQSESVTPKEVTQPVAEATPAPSVENAVTSEPKDAGLDEFVEASESVQPTVEETQTELPSETPAETQIDESNTQTVDANTTSEGLSDSDLSALAESLGFPVYQNDDIELFQEVKSWLGAPYKAAGNDKSGVDCSGLIYEIYGKIYTKELARHTAGIYDQCQSISQSDAKAGDLVFFRTDGKMEEKPNFAGIYLKNDYFVIVSSSKGVTISSLNSSYYKKNFVTVGRVRN